MKKYIYSLMLVAAGATLISNSSGRGTVSGQGASGAPGDGTTCSSGGCHGSAGPFAADIEVLLAKDGEVVTEYKPGEMYTLAVIVKTETGNPARYGFQMTALVDSDNTAAGSFSNLSSNAKALTINSRTYLEHKGVSTQDDFTATWTAPAAGSGDVIVYAAGIAANGNGGTSGDSGALGQVTFTEADVSNVKVLSSDEMNFYPNPTNNFIKVDTELNQNMVYDVLHINGAKVASGNLENNSIDISNISNGLYIVTVSGDDFIYRQKIYKR